MPTPLLVSLVAVFVGVATLAALVASQVLSWASPDRRRLRSVAAPVAAACTGRRAADRHAGPDAASALESAPEIPREMRRLRRKLAAAGHYRLSSAIYFSVSKLAVPAVTGAVPLLLLGAAEGWLIAALGIVIGWLAPDLVLARMTRARAKAMENGLPDALDLLIVCMEAGSSLDQSIVRASVELQVAHPALAHELRLITTDIRAGKPRIEAFDNFAERTRVADVRSLVAMLKQTDRFGTSIAQALRTHAQTSRTKRRQRAEERAAKIGVKLVFPLALCVFPAVYVVCIGSTVIAVYHAFFT